MSGKATRFPWPFKGNAMKKLIAAVLAALAVSAAMAHGGGTDKNGCHTDRKTGLWHCH